MHDLRIKILLLILLYLVFNVVKACNAEGSHERSPNPRTTHHHDNAAVAKYLWTESEGKVKVKVSFCSHFEDRI